MKPFNISILGSTRGSNLPGLYGGLSDTNIHIIDVISNQDGAGILNKSTELGLASVLISTDFENRLNQLLKSNAIDLVVLMGFMKILSADFVMHWENKIINVHPSLLPKHRGLMDLAVHQAVLDNKESQTGCTVHWVTEKVDSGKPIVQITCDVYDNDTPEKLKARVQKLEVDALITAIKHIAKEEAHE